METVQLTIHYSRNKFFGKKILFGETNRRTTNSIVHTICLFVIHFKRKLFCCKSTNISFEFCQKTASPMKQRRNISTKNRFSETMNNRLHTICVSPTFWCFVVICEQCIAGLQVKWKQNDSVSETLPVSLFYDCHSPSSKSLGLSASLHVNFSPKNFHKSFSKIFFQNQN